MTSLIATPLIAQCVMCFRTAAAQQAERSRVLNTGILILLIPPLLVIAAILALAWLRQRTTMDIRKAGAAPPGPAGPATSPPRFARSPDHAGPD
jgi:hypothetical protein